MRQLQIDLSELASAFDSHFDGLSNYLDLETGALVVVTDETRRQLEDLYEQMDVEEGEDAPALADLLAAENWPDWEKQLVLQADEVERGYGERFVVVPELDSHEGYRDMEDFITTVRSPHLRELLEVAITGRGAFRRFKDVLLNYPAERQRWFAFRDDLMTARVREWLEAHEIEPIADEERPQ
jgi:hypothetical protein